MVKKYFLIIFLNIFLKFDLRFARRPLVLAVGDLFRYSLNSYIVCFSIDYSPYVQRRESWVIHLGTTKIVFFFNIDLFVSHFNIKKALADTM